MRLPVDASLCFSCPPLPHPTPSLMLLHVFVKPVTVGNNALLALCEDDGIDSSQHLGLVQLCCRCVLCPEVIPNASSELSIAVAPIAWSASSRLPDAHNTGCHDLVLAPTTQNPPLRCSRANAKAIESSHPTTFCSSMCLWDVRQSVVARNLLSCALTMDTILF